jgi:hypothetical protein
LALDAHDAISFLDEISFWTTGFVENEMPQPVLDFPRPVEAFRARKQNGHGVGICP